MIHSPNYIHFRIQWQLVGRDSPGLRFPREQFQSFWADVNKDSNAGDYDDFIYRPDRCEMAKLRGEHATGGQAFSKIVWANDQLTVVEEWTECSAHEFGKRLISILSLWFRHFPTTAAVIQRCWLRALLQPTHFSDSREFLGNYVLHLKECLEGSFEKMPHQVGFTVSCARSSGDNPIIIDTKVNSWRDTPSVWVEVSGTTVLPVPINAANADKAQLHFATCLDFLEREVVGLLSKADEKPS
jgi:hypothetical protein